MEFDVNPIEIRSPLTSQWGDRGFGDAIEAEGPVVDEFRDFLAADGLFAPALEILAFFDVVDLGVADAEAPGLFVGVVVGEVEGGVAVDLAIEDLSPGWGRVV